MQSHQIEFLKAEIFEVRKQNISNIFKVKRLQSETLQNKNFSYRISKNYC